MQDNRPWAMIRIVRKLAVHDSVRPLALLIIEADVPLDVVDSSVDRSVSHWDMAVPLFAAFVMLAAGPWFACSSGWTCSMKALSNSKQPGPLHPLRLADLTHNSNICNTINMKQHGNVQKLLSVTVLLYGVLNVSAQHPASAWNDWRLFTRSVSPVILFVVDT